MHKRHTQPRRERIRAKLIDYEEMAEMQNFSASECRDVAEIGKTNANDREKMVKTRNKRSMTTAKDVQHFYID